MLETEERSCSLEVFLGRCLSDVPCAVVVVRHKKRAGRLVFATATVLEKCVFNFVVNRKWVFLI